MLAICMFNWRHYHYPKNYPFVGTPMAVFLFFFMKFSYLSYAYVYSMIESRKGGEWEEAAVIPIWIGNASRSDDFEQRCKGHLSWSGP